MKRLAIITTHPIQYNAPLYRRLSERGKITLKVFYTWSQAREKVKDAGFGKEIQWDIPLLDGYAYEFVENTATNTGSRNFWSIKNPGLIPEVKNYKPDAILILGWNFKSHLDVMRHFKGKTPVWFRGDSHLLDEKPGLQTIARRLFLKWVYRHVDKVFYVGTNNKKYFQAHGLKEEQLVYAPHAVDNQRFFDDGEKQYERKAREWRKELGYGAEDIVVLFAGKFEPKKNPVSLIHAVQQLNKSRNQQIHLLLAGNGILENELKYMTKGDPHIQFLPFQNQRVMPILYRLGDVFCLPSQGPGETWGLAVNEAMACGRPVIVSNKVGSAVDLIKNGYNGFIFESGSTADLKEKLYKIVSDPVQLNKMKGNVLPSIKNYSFEKISEAFESVI